MLTALFSASLMLGMTQVKLHLTSIDARTTAFEKLKERTEALIAKAAKNIGVLGCQDQDITIIENPDPDGSPILEGIFTYCYYKSQNSGDYSDYYNIYTKLKWPKEGKRDGYYKGDEIEFKVHQLVID